MKAFDVAIKAAGVVATLLAIIVALFKDDLRKPRVQILPAVKDWLDEGALQDAVNIGVPGVASMSYATEYFTCVHLTNVTGILAKDCQVHFVRLCKEKDTGTSLLPPLRILDSVPINPRSHHALRLWELYLPNSSEQQGVVVPALKIGEQVIETPGHGTWFSTYRLTGSNIEPIDFTIKVMWDGNWKHRKTEMNLRVEEVKS